MDEFDSTLAGVTCEINGEPVEFVIWLWNEPPNNTFALEASALVGDAESVVFSFDGTPGGIVDQADNTSPPFTIEATAP